MAAVRRDFFVVGRRFFAESYGTLTKSASLIESLAVLTITG
jgi:hypothetical protein